MTETTPKNFAMTGVAGFVAARHLRAIADTGNRLVAAVDPHDAVGVLDRYSFDVRFFTEFERFDRHLEKLRRGADHERVHYVTRLFAQLSARRTHAAGAPGRRRCDLREAAGHQPVESRRPAGARRGNRQAHLHRASAAAAPGPGRVPGTSARASGHASRGAARLSDRARPLVRRVVEGRRRTLRRDRHEHRHSLFRSAGVAVRAGAERGGPLA